MNTFLKVIGVLIVPLFVGLVVALIVKGLGCDEATVKYWAGMYIGFSYAIYMYEIGFIKKGFNV